MNAEVHIALIFHVSRLAEQVRLCDSAAALDESVADEAAAHFWDLHGARKVKDFCREPFRTFPMICLVEMRGVAAVRRGRRGLVELMVPLASQPARAAIFRRARARCRYKFQHGGRKPMPTAPTLPSLFACWSKHSLSRPNVHSPPHQTAPNNLKSIKLYWFSIHGGVYFQQASREHIGTSFLLLYSHRAC